MSKKGLIVAFSFLVAIVVMSLFSAIKNHQTHSFVKKLPLSVIDLTTFNNGDYAGSFFYRRIGYKVKVSIQEHKIAGIQILKDPPSSNRKNAQMVIDSVISAQSLQLTGTVGVAFENKLLLKAIDNALTSNH